MTERTTPSRNEVTLWTGGYFDMLNPDKVGNATVHLQTIARGLANICRYGGQVDGYYSVAEHSVILSKMVPEDLAREGLMHDCAEAILGDIRRPLKRDFERFLEVEAELETVLAAQFGLQHPWPDEVMDADNRIIWLEQRRVLDNADDWGIEEPTPEQMERLAKHGRDGRMRKLEPDQAFAAFMVRAAELGLT